MSFFRAIDRSSAVCRTVVAPSWDELHEKGLTGSLKDHFVANHSLELSSFRARGWTRLRGWKRKEVTHIWMLTSVGAKHLQNQISSPKSTSGIGQNGILSRMHLTWLERDGILNGMHPEVHSVAHILSGAETILNIYNCLGWPIHKLC